MSRHTEGIFKRRSHTEAPHSVVKVHNRLFVMGPKKSPDYCPILAEVSMTNVSESEAIKNADLFAGAADLLNSTEDLVLRAEKILVDREGVELIDALKRAIAKCRGERWN